jgi:hypothetical protein
MYRPGANYIFSTFGPSAPITAMSANVAHKVIHSTFRSHNLVKSDNHYILRFANKSNIRY